MTNWMHGYFAEAGYTYGYYPETAPMRLRWGALLQGMVTPRERFRYLDLGCGQGLNLILCAASHPESDFVGIDFMPEHVAHARTLIRDAGLTNVTVLEGDFIKLAADPSELGAFDYVVAHGITTWVHPDVRAAVFSVAGQVMNPGAIMYNSYNTLPGWLPAWPFQKLVALNQETRGGAAAVDVASDYIGYLKAQNANIATALPTLIARVEALAKQDPAYLVQEYCNANWAPMFCSDMHRKARAYKLSYLGTATLPEVFEGILPEDLRQRLHDAQSSDIREVMRDIFLNQSFRRDLYVKGGRRAPRLRHIEALSTQPVRRNPFMARPDGDAGYPIAAGSLHLTGKRETYGAVLDLVEAHEAKGAVTVGDVVNAMGCNLSDAVMTVSMLVAGGWLWLAKPTGGKDGKRNTTAKRLNAALTQAILAGEPYRYLCLPEVGEARSFSDLSLMMLGLETRSVTRDAMPDALAEALLALGRGLSRDGTSVTDSAEMATALVSDVEKYYVLRPTLHNLGAV